MQAETQNDMSMKETICGMCHFGCEIRIHVDGSGIVRVEGDPHHPVCNGFVCIKGKASLDFHTHPKRINSLVKIDLSEKMSRSL
jgi:anaerobic selenocysteine-containing dehydrogenase